jgi:hypothetical protein
MLGTALFGGLTAAPADETAFAELDLARDGGAPGMLRLAFTGLDGDCEADRVVGGEDGGSLLVAVGGKVDLLPERLIGDEPGSLLLAAFGIMNDTSAWSSLEPLACAGGEDNGTRLSLSGLGCERVLAAGDASLSSGTDSKW